jgi:hypothetical protein
MDNRRLSLHRPMKDYWNDHVQTGFGRADVRIADRISLLTPSKTFRSIEYDPQQLGVLR